MTFSQTLITIIVLAGLFILAYCRLTNKTLVEVWKEILAILKGE